MDARRLSADDFARHLARAGLTECRAETLPLAGQPNPPQYSYRELVRNVAWCRDFVGYQWPPCPHLPDAIFGACKRVAS